jgi:hypothetical protein
MDAVQATLMRVAEEIGELVDGVKRLRKEARVPGSGDDVARRLRGYRQADPGFKRSIRAFVDAEAQYGADDPAEGRLTPPETGPALSMVRALIRG